MTSSLSQHDTNNGQQEQQRLSDNIKPTTSAPPPKLGLIKRFSRIFKRNSKDEYDTTSSSKQLTSEPTKIESTECADTIISEASVIPVSLGSPQPIETVDITTNSATLLAPSINKPSPFLINVFTTNMARHTATGILP
ncbi:hypothetical protein FBU30_001521, partial [Linnemannia zychae]